MRPSKMTIVTSSPRITRNCSSVINRRPSCRRAGSPSTGAADDPCPMDCSWGTAYLPRRSHTRARRPRGHPRASRTPNPCPGSGRTSRHATGSAAQSSERTISRRRMSSLILNSAMAAASADFSSGA